MAETVERLIAVELTNPESIGGLPPQAVVPGLLGQVELALVSSNVAEWVTLEHDISDIDQREPSGRRW